MEAMNVQAKFWTSNTFWRGFVIKIKKLLEVLKEGGMTKIIMTQHLENMEVSSKFDHY